MVQASYSGLASTARIERLAEVDLRIRRKGGSGRSRA